MTEAGILKGAAHITGGGLPGNLPRILPPGLEARIQAGSWPELPIFRLLGRVGNLSDNEMWSAFNRGIGMALVVAPRNLKKANLILSQAKERFYPIGRIAKGRHGVVFE